MMISREDCQYHQGIYNGHLSFVFILVLILYKINKTLEGYLKQRKPSRFIDLCRNSLSFRLRIDTFLDPLKCLTINKYSEMIV